MPVGQAAGNSEYCVRGASCGPNLVERQQVFIDEQLHLLLIVAGLQRPGNWHQPDRLPHGAIGAGAFHAAPDEVAQAETDGRQRLFHRGPGGYLGTHLDVDSAANVIIPSTVVRGIGQPLIMVALSVLAVSGLAKDEAGSACALFSMLCNLGGAVGTAGLTRIVAMCERFHSERVGESITLFSPSLLDRKDRMSSVVEYEQSTRRV
jgi:hypothetical protein